ncbi:phospholipase [Flagellimonas aequoris]|uniref:Phosphatidylcholine 1-acylhydrolase n=2 Tax=Flagellimonas aequoris TaxID=2306997 RepID=A0A418N6L1_9FLAO|nr:phospholipase [Allomuricauda aequoris]TXK01763.1 phospholipase A [Allomuricauda aequoris]
MPKTAVVIHFIFVLLFLGQVVHSQSDYPTKNQVLDTVLPSFSIYKDAYFITGVPTNSSISKETADAKYQISFKQLILRGELPFNSHLFLTYTQKAFWNVYEFSSPFQEVNFNPGIGLGAPVFDRHDRLKGLVEMKLEHESNGRDSIYSRSWNSLSLNYNTRLGEKLMVGIKGWLPFVYKEDNPDLLNYIGFGELSFFYDFSDKLKLDVNMRKGNQWDWKGRVRTRLSLRLSETTNQHLMLEWYTGYGESLITYDQSRSMIRLGYLIKSPDLNILKRKKNKKPNR